MTASSRIPFARFLALALLAGFAASSVFADDSAVPEDIVTATMRAMADGKADAENEARKPATAEPPPFVLNRVAPEEPSPAK